MVLGTVGPQRGPHADPVADITWLRGANGCHQLQLSRLPRPALEENGEFGLAMRERFMQ
jgi:hypothetical protein